MSAHRLVTALAAVLTVNLIGTALAALPQQGTSASLLTQANVRIDGQLAGNHASQTVANAGDVNGDGIGDIIVGAPQASNSFAGAGSAYVIFGRAAPGTIDLTSLGADGFRIDGAVAGDALTQSVAGTGAASTGDVNGDGKADLVVGSSAAGAGNAAWVVFGKATTTTVALASLGTGGYKITGTANTNLGDSVAGGLDINGDGTSDTIVGAPLGGANGRGQAFVVFGKATTTAVDTTALGAAGYSITGAANNDDAGASVSMTTDMNADGKAEAVVGGDNANAGNGAAYVVFGKATTTAVDLSLFAGLSQGYVVTAASAGDTLGRTIAGIGDMNGDGKGDFVVGAQQTDNTFNNAGSAYVMFGKSTSTAVALSALGANGFRIDGGSASGLLGRSVGAAGDFNGDGIPDVIVGEVNGDAPGTTDSGISWVVFGKTSTTTIALNDATPPAGALALNGPTGDLTGRSVGGNVDFNGDGRSDVLAGDEFADPSSKANAGSAVVFYGFGTASFTIPAGRTVTAGSAIDPIVPATIKRTGTPAWSVAPALPAGVTLDAATGTVSGTPTAVQASTTYTLTMTDLSGTASQPFTLQVNAAPVVTPPATTPPVTKPPVTTPPATKPVSVKPPTITGKARAGRTLRCHRGTWNGSPTLKVQWLRNGKSIAHATRTSYKVVGKDRHKRLSCRVTATNAAGVVSRISAAKRVG